MTGDTDVILSKTNNIWNYTIMQKLLPSMFF